MVTMPPFWVALRPFWISALALIPVIPRMMVRVRQSVAVRFLTGMSLVDFGYVGKRWG